MFSIYDFPLIVCCTRYVLYIVYIQAGALLLHKFSFNIPLYSVALFLYCRSITFVWSESFVAKLLGLQKTKLLGEA
jgi:hypothetical protein